MPWQAMNRARTASPNSPWPTHPPGRPSSPRLSSSAAPETPDKSDSFSADSSVFSLDTGTTESDAGKTDVFSLEPASEGADDKKSGSGSGSSISLLDDLENITIPADPMAETVVSAPAELDAGGSTGGSGLLDLAHESDDTSLGAELYDESAESGEATPAGGSEAPAASAVLEAPTAAVPQMEYYMPAMMAEPSDPMAPAFIGMSIVGFVLLLVAGLAVSAAAVGSWPSLLGILYGNLLYFLLGAIVAAGAAWGIGFAIGRQAAGRRSAYPRAAAAGHGDLPEAEPDA